MGQCSGSEGGKFLQNDGPSPIKIILTGPSPARKSCLVYSWVLGVKNIIATKPTDTFNVEHIVVRGSWCMTSAGYPICAPERCFYEATQGIVLVVNCPDKDNKEEAKNDLDQLVGAVELSAVPVLVVANSVDSPGAVFCDELKSKLELESKLFNRKWKICSLREGSQEDADHALQELDTLV